jgi:mono/diheme cytochrome c family protein
MKRTAKFVVLVLFVFSAGAFFMLCPSGSSPISTAEAFAGPAEIYAANCARCHGVDGRANTAKGKRVEATDFTSDWNRDEARGIRIITNGKGDMPSFKKKLSAAEIKSVFGYVLRFR